MGSGSNFTVQMAFNARGYSDFGANPHYAPNLNPDTFKFRDDFLWVTHTWNHIDMYCVLSNCATPLVCGVERSWKERCQSSIKKSHKHSQNMTPTFGEKQHTHKV